MGKYGIVTLLIGTAIGFTFYSVSTSLIMYGIEVVIPNFQALLS